MDGDDNIKIRSISTAGWSLDAILNQANFVPVDRFSAKSDAQINKAIEDFEKHGTPTIIDGWHERDDWPRDLFTLDFFQRHSESEGKSNIHDWRDSTMPLDEFIAASREAPPCVAPDERVRLYGKDAECPKEWSKWIKEADVIPERLHWNGSNDYFRYRPKNARVETLMCYLGIGDTFTPAHKDLCASSGHNLMCYTENEGSSYWFMTKSSDAAKASDFFQTLGQELDHETHVITLGELAKAPFKVYVAEQKLGDLVLVPPRSCHQVVNFGGITLKTSWSRMTLDGLVTAFYHELPIYQRVCRLETYKVKSTIFCALLKQIKELEEAHPFSASLILTDIRAEGKPNSRVSALIKSVDTLLAVFRDIIAQEWSKEKHECLEASADVLASEQAMEHCLVCDFCGADVFQAYLECDQCKGVSDDGRSCKCVVMKPKQRFPFEDLLKVVGRASAIMKGFEPDWKMKPLKAYYSTFKAACLMRSIRRKYKCVLTKEIDWAIHCRSCHNSKSFTVLLQRFHLHATVAVSAYAEATTDDKGFHKVHQEAPHKYWRKQQEMEISQIEGTRGPIDTLRVHYALKYRTCRPWSFEWSIPGFYDEAIQDCGTDEPSEDREVVNVDLEFSPPGSPAVVNQFLLDDTDDYPSDDYSSDDSPSASPTVHESLDNSYPSLPQPSTSKGRRLFMDYVLVPSAPYPIPSDSMRDSSAIENPPGPSRGTKRKQRPSIGSASTKPRIATSSEGSQSDSDVLERRKPAPPKPKTRNVGTNSSVVGSTTSLLAASSSTTPSLPPSHRFKSGLVATPIPRFHSVSPSDSNDDVPPSTPVGAPAASSSKALGKRKCMDPSSSLADAMNRAHVHNAKTTPSPAKASTVRSGPSKQSDDSWEGAGGLLEPPDHFREWFEKEIRPVFKRQGARLSIPTDCDSFISSVSNGGYDTLLQITTEEVIKDVVTRYLAAMINEKPQARQFLSHIDDSIRRGHSQKSRTVDPIGSRNAPVTESSVEAQSSNPKLHHNVSGRNGDRSSAVFRSSLPHKGEQRRGRGETRKIVDERPKTGIADAFNQRIHDPQSLPTRGIRSPTMTKNPNAKSKNATLPLQNNDRRGSLVTHVKPIAPTKRKRSPSPLRKRTMSDKLQAELDLTRLTRGLPRSTRASQQRSESRDTNRQSSQDRNIDTSRPSSPATSEDKMGLEGGSQQTVLHRSRMFIPNSLLMGPSNS
ncbi:hypothetical protein CC1G_13875 [Coprinopsis cinerea okayama7|uniref:JmjC domain-containing protein n=1 Tax=Coprinopsis cinerea (strain Okayama-7 / 130 / ATCC MYA-4618 / FGSC 9003) TaxID=240176 RepID=D6RKL3_COPC7|nr:hypothetical protein CC1G_13875 [Coprinopsis cinerea okayama7\|eukprot:XP_002911839.1 hypothetical protein CC1G_13875 [Coprinopsis cinerea okayama7\